MSLQKKIDRLFDRYKTLTQLVAVDKKRYNEADELALDSAEAQEIIQAVAQTIQNQAHERIAHVVSKCLAAVFDEPYTFEIGFERKRGRTEAKLILSRDGLELGNPMDAAGGGVIDVAAFALRLSCLLLSKPARRRLLVLDEPFKFVHPPERRPLLVAMLELLADEFNVQFLIVTGIDELKCGKVIEL